MAEHSEADKQFEATASHLERAKREGNVARSTELSAVAAFACATLAVIAASGPIASVARSTLSAAIVTASHLNSTGSLQAFAMLAVFTLTPAAAAACGAVAVTFIQSGGFRLVSITISAEKLNPSRGLKRIVSRETLVSATRAMVAFACGALALIPALYGMFIGGIGQSNAERLAKLVWDDALRAIFAACAVGFVFSGFDFGIELSRWKKKLRMSFEELKRDHREHDGDPMVRGRRRALQRSMSTGSLTKIKSAAFVVSNPTHLAIGLEYRPPEIAVPRVLLRCADEAALRVRALAKTYGIPIVENVALARGLYAACETGHVIPRESYVAVAEIVAALARAGAVA